MATIKTDTHIYYIETLLVRACWKWKNINPKRTRRKRMLPFYKVEKKRSKCREMEDSRKLFVHCHFGAIARNRKKRKLHLEIYSKFEPVLSSIHNFYVQIWWLIKSIINAIYFRLKILYAKWPSRRKHRSTRLSSSNAHAEKRKGIKSSSKKSNQTLDKTPTNLHKVTTSFFFS